LEIPVIMLSATLPCKKKMQLARAYGGKIENEQGIMNAYPSLTWLGAGGEFIEKEVCGSSITRDVAINLEYGLLNDWEKVANSALAETENGGCLCIIVNTVKEAQELYKHLRRQAGPAVDTMLFHGRFCVEDRNRIETACIERFDKSSLLQEDHVDYHRRPWRAILVATQVVEQSLDLDFDIMYSAIAPIDLLVQRLGRLHRHNRPFRSTGSKPVFRILLPTEELGFGLTGKVYDEYILYQTLQCLKAWGITIHIPQDLKPMVEEVYRDMPDNLGVQQKKLLQKMQDRESCEREKGKEHLIRKPDAKKFWLAEQMSMEKAPSEDDTLRYFHAHTRLGKQTAQFLLLEETEWLQLRERVTRINKNQAKAVLQKMVSLPMWWVTGATAAEGFLPVDKIESGLLKGYQVINLIEGVWTGIDKDGKVISIRKDIELGIIREGSDK
jgi:CRISPR-associated endonuclease/helicase Cas3